MIIFIFYWYNGEVQRRQIASNSAPAAFVRPLPRSVSWLATALLRLGTDHLLEGAIWFVSKTVLLLE
jgi:hypothetical protein